MSKQILLCDDEIHILRAAEIKISRAGYRVAIAHDGQEAWESIQCDRPDLVVTDLQMPRCDGIELTRRIRAAEDTKDIPVVLLTAKGFELSRDKLVEELGIVELLAKPFSPRQLVGLIDGVLGAAPAAAN